jgi:hypothetical protein
MPDTLRLAREQAWFFNRWGIYGRTIPADLYVEQQNYWIKVRVPFVSSIILTGIINLQRVFIAGGNGVTVEYIIAKGSACVEAFREVSHSVANFFGDPDLARRHKEVKFHEDLRALIEEMLRLKSHVIVPEGNFVPAPAKATRKNKNSGTNNAPVTAEIRSAIFDVIVEGAQEWQSKFKEYIRNTTWDPKLGYPLVKEKAAPRDTRLLTGTILDSNENPISFDSYEDLHGDEHVGGLGAGALGGGDEFSVGDEL